MPRVRARHGCALVVGAALSLASGANADALGAAAACPPGTHGQQAHMGSWCIADACSDDALCPERPDGRPVQCRPMRTCSEVHRLPNASPAAMGLMDEPLTLREVTMVVEVCEADEDCDGDGMRARTAGELVEGSRTCTVQRVCVPEPFPPLGQRGTPRAAPPEPEPETEETAAPPAQRPPDGCGCRVGSVAHPYGWLALGVLVFVRRRR